MSKFRIRVKLQGFELEIDGSREEAALIGQNIGHQMSSILAPMGAIVDGETVIDPPKTALTAPILDTRTTAKKPRRKKGNGSPSEIDKSSSTINFNPNISKYGYPQQAWKTCDKIIWLMYVLKEETGLDEFSNASLNSTFNLHFKRSGAVRSSNMSRDLGIKVKERPALVGENTTKSPNAWYLTDEGNKAAQKLIAEALSLSGSV